ncbi:mucin-2 isoform X2 [Carassius auratus]|uniref:Mucin-2 isoform X2 n=1 Tax=Carassius auratus TaxID=7957 RepID=A0A6P6LNT2_CARAU|nr:interleukin-15 receptor subunit alpha isoform X2 [Carassius auratus]
MHMLFTLIFITAANMHSIARASGVCGKPELADNTKPVLSYIGKTIGETIRIECAKGYVRKAGTSSLFRCTQQQNSNACWHSDLPLKCIPDPRNPPVATKPTSPHPQVTSLTTERTTSKHPTLHDTSSPTTATGHIALTTTNEVFTTKTRRTTSQPLMSTTKETESITTTNETTTSYTSREYMTTTSSHTLSGSFTTTTGVNASVRTSTISEGGNAGAAFSNAYTSTAGGVTVIILLCLVGAFIFVCLRRRNHRNHHEHHPQPDLCISYSALPVGASEPSSAQSNKAENSTEGSVIDNNPVITHGVDTCDELLPRTDS